MKLALYYIDFYITFLFELYFLVFSKSSKRSVVVVSQVVRLLPKLVQNDECKRLGVEILFLFVICSFMCINEIKYYVTNVLMWVVFMSKFVRVHIFVNVFQNHYSFSAAYSLPLLVLERLDLLRDICAKYADKILASQ